MNVELENEKRRDFILAGFMQLISRHVLNRTKCTYRTVCTARTVLTVCTARTVLTVCTARTVLTVCTARTALLLSRCIFQHDLVLTNAVI